MGGGGPAVLIAGPTASGKSALALSLARRHGGVILNADSMQVYRDLRVLTARPSPEEEGQAPHRLYGQVDGAVNHSVARYAAEAAHVLRAVDAEGRLPIVVGGTGLYFKALTDGLSAVPAVSEEARGAVRSFAEGRDTPALHARLAEIDPEAAARLRTSDRLRVMRALEVFEGTGRSLLSFQGDRRPGPLDGRPLLRVFLAPERERLRQAIDGRFLTMLEAGALDEVERLAARGLDPLLPVMRAHGVPALAAHLRGEIRLDDAVRQGQGDTRRYAKRQFTWFRHQMPGWVWTTTEAAEAEIEAALARLTSARR